ncbi:hemolysin [Aphanizomenon flos-aquae CCAP 1446/1C]|uniref:SBBP repeat-containing protein n=1 Tax=Anabaena sp. PCC 7938 TaxID=1296340 RepID=UPI00202F3549|nr:SBBP repeat-containing protein [Anabaena sp. CCAP 1446/1C]MBY5310190.1 hemolysin [Anabaena sp. CCAP 1446/1C]
MKNILTLLESEINATILNLLNVSTPGSDLLLKNEDSEFMWGRTGNDTFIGLKPGDNNPDQLQIDIMLGDGDLMALQKGSQFNGNDRFVLGDWKQPYYADAQELNFGFKQFASILDFNPKQDTIQLHGCPEDYQLVKSPLGTAIFWKQGTVPDLIAFLPGNYHLHLEENYFQYEGDTPPPGPVLEKIQQIGSSSFDSLISSATDPNGNLFVAGVTGGSLAAANAGSNDVLVAKYDSNGNQKWIKQFGTDKSDFATSVATDNKGNFYLGGMTKGNLGEFNQGEGNYDIWIAKYDGSGKQQWFQQFGSSAFDEAYSLAVSNDGSIYSTGWTMGDLGAKNSGLYDVWVAKNDKNGQSEWIRQFGTKDYEFPKGIDSDSQGNVYITGWTLGNLGGKNAGSEDAWITKYDSNGNSLWTRQFGTNGNDAALDMKIDLNGNIFLVGYTDNNLGGKNLGSNDAWAAKFNSNGKQLWIQQFGTSKSDVATSLTIDKTGNVFVIGTTEGSLGGINAGSVDSWVAKLDSNSGKLEDFSGTSKYETQHEISSCDSSFGVFDRNSQNHIFNNDLGQSLASGMLKDFNKTPKPEIQNEIFSHDLKNDILNDFLGKSSDLGKIKDFGEILKHEIQNEILSSSFTDKIINAVLGKSLESGKLQDLSKISKPEIQNEISSCGGSSGLLGNNFQKNILNGGLEGSSALSASGKSIVSDFDVML